MAKNKSLTDGEIIIDTLEDAGYVPVVDLGHFKSNLAEHYPHGWGESEVVVRIPYWKEYGWVVMVST